MDFNATFPPVESLIPEAARGLNAVMDRLCPGVFAGLLATDGTLLYANRAALDAIGAEPRQVLGRRFDETPWWEACERSREQVREALALAAAGVPARFDVRIGTADRGAIAIDFSLLPILDPEGRVACLVPSARDVSERDHAQRELLRIRHAVEQATDALFQVSADGQVRWVNAAAGRLLGYDIAELLGMRVAQIDAGIAEAEWPDRWQALQALGALRFETWVRHRSGTQIPVDVSISAVQDGEGSFAHVCVDDLRERRAADERIRQLTQHDLLTGLPNRALLADRLEMHLQSGAPSALLAVDLDRFRRVNDGLGSAAGDLLLQAAARRIAAALRPGDWIARPSSDEFVVLLRGVDEPAARRTAQNVLGAFAEPFDLDGETVHLTCSIGIALSPEHGDAVEQLLRRAGAALIRAKAAGRNGLALYRVAPFDEDPERWQLENALRGALARRELALHYQPQCEFRDGRIVGAEALLRWRSPTLGEVAPDRFIPVAEEIGMIGAIGDWVLAEACRQAAAWRRDGLRPLRIAVNLSARQLQQSGLAERVERLLDEQRLQGCALGLEVTEGMLIENLEQACATLARLRALGVEIALDDFGTGYSSLSYLRRLPVDLVKIDRSLVADVTDPRASITRAVIALAQGLDLRVLAEGVETAEQLERLASHGCDLAQGFVLGRPLTAAAFGELLCASDVSKPE
ncbi:bifunctional diguanylate cyclase/phosphodiesterase [Pseudacidovorax sp. RU35E]|uniref:putative bifunctional diguanylate cyclase/phosphodiesterase n=1 Tax=Pseudacidovorax sp. RU35E TaxID=1907403 RepID=UPI0009564DEB|nr:EAL domain-containing protein [Pseudacidovorax sp. RU35E]SIQ60262.1 diguanylate cyclase/phosphodiesterase with PAS/PAC sensor(s) [Pseudacidovorax sp. RU35E]